MLELQDGQFLNTPRHTLATYDDPTVIVRRYYKLQLLFGCLSATARSIRAAWCLKLSSQTYFLRFFEPQYLFLHCSTLRYRIVAWWRKGAKSRQKLGSTSWSHLGGTNGLCLAWNTVAQYCVVNMAFRHAFVQAWLGRRVLHSNASNSRGVAFLVDAWSVVATWPQAAASIVRNGAVELFCQRLLTIEYIDLAEQSLLVGDGDCLVGIRLVLAWLAHDGRLRRAAEAWGCSRSQALEKLSHDHAAAVLRQGGLMAVSGRRPWHGCMVGHALVNHLGQLLLHRLRDRTALDSP
jgi:hypothetical protein